MSPEQQQELTRVKRVSDMLCTGHAVLRDRYSRYAVLLDILTLACSTWLVALAFVSPELASRVSPFHWDPTIWLGVLSAATFFLTLVQMKTDWKGKADAHRRTLDLYVEVKREAGYLLALGDADDLACRKVLAGYEMASAAGVEVPESDFLRLKKAHKQKIAISKHLDGHPSASILLIRLRMWIHDNRAKVNSD